MPYKLLLKKCFLLSSNDNKRIWIFPLQVLWIQLVKRCLECYIRIVLQRRTCWWASPKISKLVMNQKKFSKKGKVLFVGWEIQLEQEHPSCQIIRKKVGMAFLLTLRGGKVVPCRNMSHFCTNNVLKKNLVSFCAFECFHSGDDLPWLEWRTRETLKTLYCHNNRGEAARPKSRMAVKM